MKIRSPFVFRHSHSRRLTMEPLEDRHLLAVFTVSNLNDTGAGSLRDAVEQANSLLGADQITFTDAATSGAIGLTSGELEITETLTISGPGQESLKIDAQKKSRVLNFSAPTGDLTLEDIEVTGGRTFGAGAAGGGILFTSNGTLALTRTAVTGNITTGVFSPGGGIYATAGAVQLTDSVLNENSTGAQYSDGGGIRTTTGAVTITGSMLSGNRTAGEDAAGGAISTTLGSVMMIGSTLLGNSTMGDNSCGGGISTSLGTVLLTESTVSENSTIGSFAEGGGIHSFSGEVTLIGSIVSGNTTTGSSGRGGGISAGAVSLFSSTVSENSTAGINSGGGGIYSNGGSGVAVNSSTVSGNRTMGNTSQGGGIQSVRDLTLVRSTVSGNRTGGIAADGGGLYANGDVILTHSTISGNHADARSTDGGGIFTRGNVTVTYSTIIGNSAEGQNSHGGGIFVSSFFLRNLTVENSIIAGNTEVGGTPNDLTPDSDSTLTVNYSLLGASDGLIITGNLGNLTGTVAQPLDPLIGPLADNGGPTQTHAVLPSSLVFNTGDPSAVAGQNGVPDFDQRDVGYGRVRDGRIDMGAFELQQVPPSCDFDSDLDCDVDDIDAMFMEILANTNNGVFDLTGDGNVDLADRDMWLTDAGAMNLSSGGAFLLGDANLDGSVNGSDFVIWNSSKFTSTGKWSQADWNADGQTDGADFVVWNSNKFQDADGRMDEDSKSIRRRHNFGKDRFFEMAQDGEFKVNWLVFGNWQCQFEGDHSLPTKCMSR